MTQIQRTNKKHRRRQPTADSRRPPSVSITVSGTSRCRNEGSLCCKHAIRSTSSARTCHLRSVSSPTTITPPHLKPVPGPRQTRNQRNIWSRWVHGPASHRSELNQDMEASSSGPGFQNPCHDNRTRPATTRWDTQRTRAKEAQVSSNTRVPTAAVHAVAPTDDFAQMVRRHMSKACFTLTQRKSRSSIFKLSAIVPPAVTKSADRSQLTA